MIRSLQISHFKGFRQAEVDFERLTLLVGPNGAGKTSLLEALWLLSQVSKSDVVRNIFQFKWSPSHLVWSGRGTAIIRGKSDRENEMKIELSTEPNRPDLALWLNGESAGVLAEDKREGMRDFGHISKMRFDAVWISEPSSILSQEPTIDLVETGYNMPSYLQYLHNLRDGSIESIESAVREIIPKFKKISFRPTAIQMEEPPYSEPGVALFLELSDATIPASHASEGTLLVLALLTAVLAPGGHRTLLIDDLDRALHPAAQVRVLAVIRKVMEAVSDLQIIATTHSPDLVDACEPSEVRVLGFDEQGEPVVAPLLAHPEAATWLKQLRPGEFWNSAGEDWVARARHQPEPPAITPEDPREAQEHG